jgi:hypothetical protein
MEFPFEKLLPSDSSFHALDQDLAPKMVRRRAFFDLCQPIVWLARQ